MNILINPRPNLLIDLSKNRIISYETPVAKIDFENGVIKPAGKFSRTTSKQIQYVSEVLGFATEKVNNQRGDFWMLHEGVKVSYRGALGESASKRVIESLKELKDPTLSLVDAYNQTSKRSQDLEILRGMINGLGADLEETTKEINALRKVRDMII
jgi:hypothetical protein